MKQNLLKTMLFSAALVAGSYGGVMADNIQLQPTDDTYLDWANADKNFGSEQVLPAGIWQEMWTNATPGLKGYTSRIVLMKFNVKDYVGKITKATLSVTGTNAATNTNTRSIYLGTFDETSWKESTVTASNSGMFTRDAKNLNIHPLGISVSIPKGKTQKCSFSNNNLLDYLNNNADADGNVSLIIYGLGQECSVASKESDSKPILEIEYAAEQLYTATFTESSGLTPEVKVYSDEACTTEVSAATLKSNTKYYYVATLAGYEDCKGEFTVGTENPSISFTMVKKALFTYHVNLVDESDNVLLTVYTTDEAYEGLPVNYSYPKYLTDENGKVTYVCELSKFSGSVSASKDAPTNVKYKAYKGNAYFVEGEKVISGTNVESENYSFGTAVRGFDTDKDLLTIPESGVYRLTYAVCSNNVKAVRQFIVSANDQEIVNKDVDWSVNKVLSDGTITEADQAFAKGTVIKAKGSDTNIILDYILLEKVGEQVAVSDLTYATYVPACNVVAPENVKVYTVKANEAKSSVTLNELTVGTVIPAGTAVLVGAPAETYTFTASADAAPAITENDLQAATADTKGDGATTYALTKKDGKPVFGLVAEGVTIPEGKAYLQLSAPSAAKYFAIGTGVVTGINEVNAAANDADDAYYTLQGMKTNKAAKGIYIHNGKKVVIK